MEVGDTLVIQRADSNIFGFCPAYYRIDSLSQMEIDGQLRKVQYVTVFIDSWPESPEYEIIETVGAAHKYYYNSLGERKRNNSGHFILPEIIQCGYDVNLAGLPAGVYYLMIRINGNTTKMEKIIKK